MCKLPNNNVLRSLGQTMFMRSQKRIANLVRPSDLRFFYGTVITNNSFIVMYFSVLPLSFAVRHVNSKTFNTVEQNFTNSSDKTSPPGYDHPVNYHLFPYLSIGQNVRRRVCNSL